MNQEDIMEANRFEMEVAIKKYEEKNAKLDRNKKITFKKAQELVILRSNAEICRFKWLLHKEAVEDGTLNPDYIKQYDFWWNTKETAKESKTAEELFKKCFLVMRILKIENIKHRNFFFEWLVDMVLDDEKAYKLKNKNFGD